MRLYEKSAEHHIGSNVELAEIEASRPGNLDIFAENDAGQPIQMTPGRVRVLVANHLRADELIRSNHFFGELEKQANRDVAQAIDTSAKGSLVYPAGAWDSDTTKQALTIFPNITDVHMVDHSYQNLLRVSSYFFYDFVVFV